MFIRVAVTAWLAAGVAHAADIRVLAGSAVQPVMEELVPAFERESGHRVIFEWGAAGGMAQRVGQGDAADAAVVTAPQMDALIRESRVAAQTRLDLGQTGVGVFVRKGARRPDIATAENFKRAMLEARSIGYNDPAAGAPVSIYLMGLFERMGISAQMTPKTVVFKKRGDRFDAVARGEVEIGFNQVSEIVAQPSVDLVGPLPSAIQNMTTLSVAVLTNATHPQAAKELVEFLRRPESIATFTRKGFEKP
jgi:molybdate transport system substrate-binding protein